MQHYEPALGLAKRPVNGVMHGATATVAQVGHVHVALLRGACEVNEVHLEANERPKDVGRSC